MGHRTFSSPRHSISHTPTWGTERCDPPQITNQCFQIAPIVFTDMLWRPRRAGVTDVLAPRAEHLHGSRMHVFARRRRSGNVKQLVLTEDAIAALVDRCVARSLQSPFLRVFVFSGTPAGAKAKHLAVPKT